jgi:hypothetical protein
LVQWHGGTEGLRSLFGLPGAVGAMGFSILSACSTRWNRASWINNGLAVWSCHLNLRWFFPQRASHTIDEGLLELPVMEISTDES